MKARVIRSGQHSGGDHFVEVQETPSSPPYAVPVNAALEIGTLVEIAVAVAELPERVEAIEAGADVTVPTEDTLVVEKSPIVGDERHPDTAPSGQSEPKVPAVRPERTLGEDVALRGDQ